MKHFIYHFKYNLCYEDGKMLLHKLTYMDRHIKIAFMSTFWVFDKCF